MGNDLEWKSGSNHRIMTEDIIVSEWLTGDPVGPPTRRGSPEMAVDGGTVPSNFMFLPISDVFMMISMTFALIGATPFTYDKFNSTAVLPVGVEVCINNKLYATIKTNTDLLLLIGTTSSEPFSTVNKSIVGTIDFLHNFNGNPVQVRRSTGGVHIRINDDLTTASTFRCQVNGYIVKE